MTPQLRRDLEDCELARPGGEPTLTPKVVRLGHHVDHGVRGSLVGEIVELGTGDPELWAPAVSLAPRHPHQKFMETNERGIVHGTDAAQACQPRDGIGIEGPATQPALEAAEPVDATR